MSDNVHPEILQHLIEISKRAVKAENIDDSTAETIAESIADQVKKHWAGQQIYIPFAVNEEIKIKHKIIKQQFTGNNQADLARKHGLSLQRIYTILKK